MINNPESIANKYRCNKIVANYLMYQKQLPLLALKGGKYYFTYDSKLFDIITRFPVWVKVASLF
jgi:hypothetical protein